MSRYIYKAKDGPGRTVEGELTAESRHAALAGIDAMGYSPIWVRERESASRGRGFLRMRSIRHRDVTLFTHQLASLIKGGVPILKALSTVSEQTESKAFQKVIEDMRNITRDGNTFSESLSVYPEIFSELYVNMVRSGESAGVLDTVLFRLAEAGEKEEETRRKVQSATAYPVLIVIVGIITVFVLLAFFLPRVIELFSAYKHRTLPLPTRILVAASDFFSHYWYWIIIAVFMLWALVKRFTSFEKGRLLTDWAKLRLPLVSKFIRYAEIARFARTLSLLISSGVAIDKALALSADTLRNAVLRAEIMDVRRETVQQGTPMSVGLKRSLYFPPLVANMVAIGEESGSLDESLDEIASFFEREVDQQSRMMTSLLEPILILIVGGIVGFIVSAMLLPIFELSTSL